MATICEMKPNYILTEEENASLKKSLSTIIADPYRQYNSFCYQVLELIKNGRVPKGLIAAVKDFDLQNHQEKPFIFIKNMPYDEEVEFFDNENPVQSKYELKKTFIGEGSLYLVGCILNQTPIGYLNVNGGDVFQDIYPQKRLKDSQSQKALGPIYFHKDLANHYVRPDYVNMLSMRGSEKNEIFTTFVKNIDIISSLTEEEIQEYRKTQFYTPFDDLTTKAGSYGVGEASMHPIISGDYDIRFFENRTEGKDERSQKFVELMKEKMHAAKKSVQMVPGDFIGVANNYSVHGKEIGNMPEPELAWQRWTMKTVNVRSIEPHRQHLVAGSEYLIQG